jgi:hypothetical protein
VTSVVKVSSQNVTVSSINKTAGTQTNLTKFSTFQDPVYGIKVLYPRNWTKIEGVNYVEFQAPLPSISATSQNQLIAFEIRIDYLPSFNKYTSKVYSNKTQCSQISGRRVYT